MVSSAAQFSAVHDQFQTNGLPSVKPCGPVHCCRVRLKIIQAGSWLVLCRAFMYARSKVSELPDQVGYPDPTLNAGA